MKFITHFKFLSFCILLLLGFKSQSQSTPSFYPITPVGFTEVELNDSFWNERIKINREVTIPIAFKRSEETGRIRNFAVAGGIEDGTFNTNRGYDDSDVYKVMEGAAYSLAEYPDPVLEGYLDSLIELVGKAQENDGYLYTIKTILGLSNKHRDTKDPRWLGIEQGTHELYNVGHMYEAAVAHYEATGKRTFLNIAIKNANLVDSLFGWNKLELVPGHQEIEIGLVKLYRVTGNQKYLNLSKFFLDKRGDNNTIDWTYNQTHERVTEQEKAVGHSVRASYMYTAMADIAALTKDRAYVNAMSKLWHDIVDTKLYIIGGIGAAGGHEGFGDHYELPNYRAYNETCAAIANVFWNYRLFLTHGDAKYIDVLERSLYNNVLSGVSLTGDKFFYPNRLESRGETIRSEWFETSCCPSNVTRYMPSIPGYIYAHTDNAIFVNLFLSSETSVNLGGDSVKLTQVSQLPWSGKVQIKIDSKESKEFAVKIRIPGWATENPVPSNLYRFREPLIQPTKIMVNQQNVDYELQNGYAIVSRKWNPGDEISIRFPYEVRVIESHEKITTNKGRAALQAGPIVYCVEGFEVPGSNANHIYIDPNQDFHITYEKDLLGGVNTINGIASLLMETAKETESERFELRAIPYYGWANRGASQMIVWIPESKEVAVSKPLPTLASTSQLSTSKEIRIGTLDYVNDLYKPGKNGEVTQFSLWPVDSGIQSLTYKFGKMEQISSSAVYWANQSGEDDFYPKSWKLFYKQGDKWKEIKASYPIAEDGKPSEVSFKEVTTDAIKLEFVLGGKPAGIYEWEVK